MSKKEIFKEITAENRAVFEDILINEVINRFRKEKYEAECKR